MEKKKEYSNGEITVVWKPDICIHSANCVKGLPSVFKPNDSPWIQVDEANSVELMATIDKCPSGALTYYRKANGSSNEKTDVVDEIRVEVFDNGPLVVHGTMEITHTDGHNEIKKRSSAFCRCGKTGNNPFCDGSHKN